MKADKSSVKATVNNNPSYEHSEYADPESDPMTGSCAQTPQPCNERGTSMPAAGYK